ncbi:lasso peptide biosynthesis B2 protein [Salinarimonas ramus]|uniref:Microcin J25-processing protein McjB C-terminal domain-containing protein n=1 Tax=Salinarimonas ramus TaxID=690164 RepID=A0A917QA69_9HYPH|nr:lasso peptide biosynthesis B2 protein [Salinarimonas ramus]GGK37738.1 hypothetical protein GCM10011322_25970 [Salinarimonas ramus]
MRPPSLHEARLLARALISVARTRATLRPNRLGAILDRTAATPSAPRTPASLADMREIAWSVRNAARLVPGATCLTQALAGRELLAARGRRSAISITLPKGGDAPRPHAWLLCEDTIVLGGTAVELAGHRPLTAYASDTPDTVVAETPR